MDEPEPASKVPAGGDAVEPVSAALALIDEANSRDPTLISAHRSIASGASGDRPDIRLRPKELLHSERMTYWVGVLEPSPTAAQLLAARAHHLERWKSPRADFPDGLAGYLRWRVAARERHVADVEALLIAAGVDAPTREATAGIVAKRGLGTDPAVQTHEDALCLVFLELQGASTAAALGARAQRVFTRTVAKMSPRARALAATLELDDTVATLVGVAVAGAPPDSLTR